MRKRGGCPLCSRYVGYHRPRLTDYIDFACGRIVRAQPNAVIRKRTGIPAVEKRALDRRFECVPQRYIFFTQSRVYGRQHFIYDRRRKLRKPNALPSAAQTYFVQSVVPIAAADEQKSVLADFQAVYRAQNVAQKRVRPARCGAFHSRTFIIGKRRRRKIRYFLIQNIPVRSKGYIFRGDISQEKPVVGDTSAHAQVGAVPPMHNVAFFILMSGALQDNGADIIGIGIQVRQTVLQLIAETNGSARLIKSASGAEP